MNTSKTDILINDCLKNKTIANHPSLLKDICRQYKIESFFNFYNEHDKTRDDDSYHNKQHSYIVALNCYEAACYHALSFIDTRNLILAGLFHDFNHSQGYCIDKKNIEFAINGIKIANVAISKDEQIKEEDLFNVIRIIKATQYPYTVAKLTDISKMIIRDADLMMPYVEPNSRNKFYLGLVNEMLLSSDFTMSQFCEKQQAFFTKINWNTVWAKTKAVTHNYPKLAKDVIFALKSSNTIFQ